MSKKTIILIAVVVLAGAAAAVVYVKMQSAQSEIAAITEMEESAIGEKDLQRLTTESVADLRELEAAAALKDKAPELWLKVLKKQLTHENTAVRMAAITHLKTEGSSEALALLEAVSADESQDKVLRMKLIQEVASLRIAKAPEAQRRAMAMEFLKDQRPGFRIVGLETIAQVPGEETVKIVSEAAENDPDEDVQLMAEVLLEKLGVDTEEEE